MAFDPTREEVARATDEYLIDGGVIHRLPDTVEDQKAWLKLMDSVDPEGSLAAPTELETEAA